MANRKNPSRRSRNAKKPAVIDATALEVESAGTETPADMDESAAADENPSTPAEETSAAGTAEKDSASASDDGGAEADTGSTDTGEPVDHDPAGASAKAPSGKGKWIAAGLAAVLLSGIAGGGYLYRTYGEQLFGTSAANKDIAALEGQVMDASGAAQSAREAAEAVTGQIAGVNQRIDALEKAVQEAASSSDPAPDPALAGAIAKAQETADAALAGTEQLSGRTTGLDSTIAGLKDTVSSLQSALQEAAKSGGGADQAAINLTLEELSKKVEAVEATASAASSPDLAELEALKQELATNRQSLASLGSQVETLTANLAAATARLDEASAGQSSAPDLAGIVRNIDALANAVSAGTPFQAELDQLREQASLPALPALNANASSGIMTAATLEQRLGEIDKALKGPLPDEAAAPGGIWGMVQSKISSVVKVRSLDETDWSRVAAGARQALTSGGLDAAIASLSGKPDGMPAELASWLVEARKRTAAQAELDSLPQALMSAAPAAGQSQ
jgi:predicted  nucleic acid-binding Zn-ribbon protein